LSDHTPIPRTHCGSKFLPDQPTYSIQRRIAEMFGDLGAHLLHQLDWYLTNLGEIRDGTEPDERRWILATYEDWHDEFSWYHEGTIRVAFKKLEALGIVVGVQVFGARSAKWYTIDYAELDAAIAAQPESKRTRGVMRRLLDLRSRPCPPPEDDDRKCARARALHTRGRALRAPAGAQNAQAVGDRVRISNASGRAQIAAPPVQNARPLNKELDKGELDNVVVDDGSGGSTPGPTPTDGAPAPPLAPPELIAALNAAGVSDAAQMAAMYPRATVSQVRKLHADAERLRRNGKLRGTMTGVVISGLKKGWQADRPPEPPAPAAAKVRPSGPLPSDTNIALAKLHPDDFDALAAAALASIPENFRATFARTGPSGPALRGVMHTLLDRGWRRESSTSPLVSPSADPEGGAPCPQ
jgi:hypothetical protein